MKVQQLKKRLPKKESVINWKKNRGSITMVHINVFEGYADRIKNC